MSWGMALALAGAILALAQRLRLQRRWGVGVVIERQPVSRGSTAALPANLVALALAAVAAFAGGGLDTLLATSVACVSSLTFVRLGALQYALVGGSSLLLVAASASFIESLQSPGAGLRITPLFGLAGGCLLASILHRRARLGPGGAARGAAAWSALEAVDLLGLQVAVLVALIKDGSARMQDFGNALSYPLMLAACVLLCAQTAAWGCGARRRRGLIVAVVLAAVVLWPVSLWQMIGNHGRSDGTSFAVPRLWACAVLGLLAAALWLAIRRGPGAGRRSALVPATLCLLPCVLLAGPYGLTIAVLTGAYLAPALNSGLACGSG